VDLLLQFQDSGRGEATEFPVDVFQYAVRDCALAFGQSGLRARQFDSEFLLNPQLALV
jgi:hypothetical protein